MGQLLPFLPSDTELEAAWAAFEAARDHAESLCADRDRTTARQRMEAAMDANRLHRAFARLCARAEARR